MGEPWQLLLWHQATHRQREQRESSGFIANNNLLPPGGWRRQCNAKEAIMAFTCPGEFAASKPEQIGTITLQYDVPADPNADAVPKGFTADPPGAFPTPNAKIKQVLDDNAFFRKATIQRKVLKTEYDSFIKQESKDCSQAGVFQEFTSCTYKRAERITCDGALLSFRFLDDTPIIREDYGDYCIRRIFLFLIDIGLQIYRDLADKDRETSRKVALLPSNFRANFEDPDKFASLMETYQAALEGRGSVGFDEPALVPPVISEVAFRDFGRLLGNRTVGEPRDVPQLEVMASGRATFDDIVDELVNLDDREAQDLVQLIGDIQNRRIAAGGVSTDEAWMIEAVDAIENRDPGDWPSLIFGRGVDV